MDEYLSEKEQLELIRQWWRENGWYLIGGAVVAALGYYGYGQYVDFRNRQAEQAAALYLELQSLVEDDRTGTDDVLARLVDEYPDSPYTDQARLLLARDRLVSDPDRAIDELRTVMETSSDPGIAMIARLRLARVLAYRELYDEALTTLEVEDPGDFFARINDIRGDIHVSRGAYDDARRAYTQALTGPGADALDRNLLQMKLGDLPVTAPAADAADPADASVATDDVGAEEGGA